MRQEREKGKEIGLGRRKEEDRKGDKDLGIYEYEIYEKEGEKGKQEFRKVKRMRGNVRRLVDRKWRKRQELGGEDIREVNNGDRKREGMERERKYNEERRGREKGDGNCESRAEEVR